MHRYDTVLKDLLTSPQNSLMERITGARIDHWLNVEFPEVQQTRVDLLGETADRRVIALEFQSTNDPRLPLRMAEYAIRICRIYDRLPEQYVLYVGNPEMRMPDQLTGPSFSCRYKLMDIRSLDEESLLNSPFDADSIMAILTLYRDNPKTIRRILARIARMEGNLRDMAVSKLTILSGLRGLDKAIKREAKYMPILDDIMDHGIIGPAIREGLQKGREEGREEGLKAGEIKLLSLLIRKRFGGMPAWADERLAKLSAIELDEVGERLLDGKTKTIEELLKS